MYIPRTLRKSLTKATKFFPVILITGPRQVGKTTLLKQLDSEEFSYVSLDDLDERILAQNDPKLFLQKYKCPLIIDEIQYAPELFSVIKMKVDEAQKPAMFFLTGSQRFHLMENVSETLAGRIAIIDILGLTQAEITFNADKSKPFLPSDSFLTEDLGGHRTNLELVYEAIFNGSFPRLIAEEGLPRDLFFDSYVKTYIERDVQNLANVGDELKFNRFIKAVAARTAQLINYADLARDVDIDQKTAKQWLSILESSGLVYLLQPYHSNLTKRLIKTPKLYFLDTGLAAFLCAWTSPESLEAGAMSGAIFETYIFSEILKSYYHNIRKTNFFFYRDKDKKEIDLLIEADNKLYPIEFKKTASPSKDALKNFEVLKNLDKEIGYGAVICLRESPILLSEKVLALPVSYIL